MISLNDRLTYKSGFGDYGSNRKFENDYQEKCALRNALGAYEDLGFDINEIRKMAFKLMILDDSGKIDQRKINELFS